MARLSLLVAVFAAFLSPFGGTAAASPASTLKRTLNKAMSGAGSHSGAFVMDADSVARGMPGTISATVIFCQVCAISVLRPGVSTNPQTPEYERELEREASVRGGAFAGRTVAPVDRHLDVGGKDRDEQRGRGQPAPSP